MNSFNTDRPKTMKALVLKEFDGNPQLAEMPVPEPRRGEVLIKIHASPINPSDWAFIRGRYNADQKPMPVIPGFEASGTVIASGSDFMSRRLMGKMVACFAPRDGHGTWAQYMLTKSNFAIPLKKDIDPDQGSMVLVNPFSAYAMVELAVKEKHAAIANTAAASALGQMMIRKCNEHKLPLVNIVRRQEQVVLLKEKGAKHVLNSSEKDFHQKLKEVFHLLNVTLAYDAVAGDLTEVLIDALPDGGKVSVYGGLSESPCPINPGHLIFEKKSINGFWLSEWIAKNNMISMIFKSNAILKNFNKQFYSRINKKVSLQEFQKGRDSYLNEMTAGKVLIMPNI